MGLSILNGGDSIAQAIFLRIHTLFTETNGFHGETGSEQGIHGGYIGFHGSEGEHRCRVRRPSERYTLLLGSRTGGASPIVM